MKKKNGLLVAFIPFMMIICLFIVFSPRIDCKPNHASFWLILALGMSVGVALTRTIQWFKEKKKQ